MPGNNDPKGENSQETGPLWSGPLIGEVGEQDAFIWAQGRDTSALTLAIFPPAGATIALQAVPALGDGYCVRFHAVGLTPATTYEYEISSPHAKTSRYQFTTAPSPQARQCRVAFGSCYHFYNDNHAPNEGGILLPPTPHIFDAIHTYQPNLFIMAGDNCYYGYVDGNNDFLDETHMLLAQLAHRNNPALQQLVHTTSTLGVWDNHDYGPGQSGAEYAKKAAALLVFKRVWAQRQYGQAPTTSLPQGLPGVFSSVRHGPVEVFLIDDRYYRQARDHILGPGQLAWLKNRLKASTASVKLLVSGSVVLPEFVFISDLINQQHPNSETNWEGWQKDAHQELLELLNFIETSAISGVMFLSGDLHIGYLLHRRARHMAGGLRGPEFYEIVSSPLRNDVWTTRVHTDTSSPYYDATLVSEALHNNFGLIDIDLDRPGNEVTLRLKDTQGHDLASLSIALDSLRVRPRIDKLTGLVWPNGKAYFFKGARYVRYERDPAHEGVDPEYPKPIAGNWPRLMEALPDGFDTAVVWPNGKAYFFKGNGYVAYLVDPNAEGVIDGYPKYTDLNWAGWPDGWAEGIDAGLVWDATSAYFFRGTEYLRYNIPNDRVDPGYPKLIKDTWPGLAEAFPEGVDSAIDWGNGIVYFFRGNSYVRYRKDPAHEGVEPGYPRAIQGNWPGL